jgi:hypothetical protein
LIRGGGASHAAFAAKRRNALRLLRPTVLAATFNDRFNAAYNQPGQASWPGAFGVAQLGSSDTEASGQSSLINEVGTQSLSYTTVAGPTLGPSGAANWSIRWGLAQPSPAGGIIVQEVMITAMSPDPSRNVDAHYWEAWRVAPGSQVTTRAAGGFLSDDTWAYRPQLGSSNFNSITWTASAIFYEGQTLPPSFRLGGVLYALGLPSTYQNPNLPTANATPPVNRTFGTNR